MMNPGKRKNKRRTRIDTVFLVSLLYVVFMLLIFGVLSLRLVRWFMDCVHCSYYLYVNVLFISYFIISYYWLANYMIQ